MNIINEFPSRRLSPSSSMNYFDGDWDKYEQPSARLHTLLIIFYFLLNVLGAGWLIHQTVNWTRQIWRIKSWLSARLESWNKFCEQIFNNELSWISIVIIINRRKFRSDSSLIRKVESSAVTNHKSAVTAMPISDNNHQQIIFRMSGLLADFGPKRRRRVS